MLLIGLVPEKVNAAEPDVYKVTIHPNKNNYNIYNLSLDEENMILNGVGVNYKTDFNNNTVDIHFDEPIFISDIISKGNAVHESIEFNNYETIEVNQNLETSGYRKNEIDNIVLKYSSLEDVESITLCSANIEDYLNGYFDEVDYSDHDCYVFVDNDLNTGAPISIGAKPLSIKFDKPIDITGYIFNANFYANIAYLYFYNDEGEILYSKKHYNIDSDILFNVNIKNVKRVYFYLNHTSAGSLYEFEVFYNNDIIPPGDIINLNYVLEDGNVNLTWVNPIDEDFSGVNIYRNSILIEKNYIGESYVDRNLLPGLYEYKITTIDEFGNESEGVDIFIKIEKPPEDVKDFNYTVEDNSITMTWINPDSAEGVNIYRNGELIETTTEEIFSENLSPGIYEYKITVLESGQESQGIIIKVSIQSAPTTVKNIRIINMTSTGGEIMWTENPAYENVIKYAIYVNGEKHGEIETPPYPIEGLEEGQTYNIGVTAINSYGESEPPATITFTPTKLSELKNSINIGDIFSYISILFKNIWPLLAIALAIIISPKIYNLIKTNVT